MTIGARECNRGKTVCFEVAIQVTYPDGRPYLLCMRAPLGSKSAGRAPRLCRRKCLSIVPEAAVLFRARPKEFHGPVERGRLVGAAIAERGVLACRHLLRHVLDEKAATTAGK